MKKRFAGFLILTLLCLGVLSGCIESPEYLEGTVVACGGQPYFFELACPDGKNYGFVVDEQTKLIWEDRSAFDIWKDDADEWDVFGCDMQVRVESGSATESADLYVDECVEGWYLARKVIVESVDADYFSVTAKPVIYLYPEEPAEIHVELDYAGVLSCTYPRYEEGWTVEAQPDGTLYDAEGQCYNYLYWEGVTAAEYDFSQGFCIPGTETAAFLEESLMQLGLNRREANEFIVYWLPQMEGNAYNLIAFQSEAYTNAAQLHVTPEPETVLRVFMAWMPQEKLVEVEPQTLLTTERSGFTLVEWGGTQVK